MRHAFFFSRQRSQEIFESEHAVLLSVAIYVEATFGIDEEDLCDLRFQGQTIVEFAKHFQNVVPNSTTNRQKIKPDLLKDARCVHWTFCDFMEACH